MNNLLTHFNGPLKPRSQLTAGAESAYRQFPESLLRYQRGSAGNGAPCEATPRTEWTSVAGSTIIPSLHVGCACLYIYIHTHTCSDTYIDNCVYIYLCKYDMYICVRERACKSTITFFESTRAVRILQTFVHEQVEQGVRAEKNAVSCMS